MRPRGTKAAQGLREVLARVIPPAPAGAGADRNTGAVVDDGSSGLGANSDSDLGSDQEEEQQAQVQQQEEGSVENVAASEPRTVEDLPVYSFEQDNFSHSVDQAKLTLKAYRVLKSPLPNLFRQTFEQAARQSPGEQWLRQRIQDFDGGGRSKRKRVLQDFLEYVTRSTASSMEELFSNQAQLFFVRLTSWFSITLPTFYELPLQMKVFLTFLEFREQVFIRAFFESGTVVPLMHTLSVDFDVSDEVRCLAIMVLHKLAANGRQHKELLCAQGLINNILDCASDGLRWETLKFSGRLLCELFHANPKYQVQALDALQELMSQRLPLTQRVGTQAIISLLVGKGRTTSPLLRDPARHRALVQRALVLLESQDLRVGADAYCLLCTLLRTFNCDDLLVDFARRQLRAERDNTQEWARIEVDAQTIQDRKEDASAAANFGGRHQGTVTRLHERVAAALAAAGGPPEDATEGNSDPTLRIRRANQSNVEFCEAFRAEAGCVLKWGLLMYLSKRSASLCAELVDGGLTETLLMCLLDVAHPVRQGAALVELQRLQLLSPKAKQIAEAILVKKDLLQAMALDSFMRAASPSDLSRARLRLRNMRTKQKVTTFSAKEHGLQQHLIEKDAAHSLNIRPLGMGDAFLTQPAEAGKGDEDGEVARSGPKLFSVQRVPHHSDTGQSYRVDRGPIDEIPFCGSLSSFLIDPLDLTADEDSPLIQELRNIEASVGLGSLGRGVAGSPGGPAGPSQPPRPRRDLLPRKPSHRPTAEHYRAMALRAMPPPGVEPRPPVKPRRAQIAIPDDVSETTEVSLDVIGPEDLISKSSLLESVQHSTRMASCRGHAHAHDSKHSGASHFASLAETSVGLDPLSEFSHEYVSTDLTSVSQQDALAAGQSIITLATDSLEMAHSLSDRRLSQGDFRLPLLDAKGRMVAQVVQRSTIASLIEVPRRGDKTARGRREAAAAAERAAAEGRDPAGALAKVHPQKRILCVARAPFHDCVAFDRFEAERDRVRRSDQVAWQMRPGTQRLFVDLQRMGTFPRKGLVKGSGGSKSARGPGTSLPPMFSGDFGVLRRMMEQQAAEEAAALNAEDDPEGMEDVGDMPILASDHFGDWQQLMGGEPGDDEPPLPELQNPMRGKEEKLMDFFPASARTPVAA